LFAEVILLSSGDDKDQPLTVAVPVAIATIQLLFRFQPKAATLFVVHRTATRRLLPKQISRLSELTFIGL
jgi:mannose/fructose/N-acetylgalactosamine-specific phosphotransferase system component IIC